ncbi:hypothetical protein I5U90_01350 [Stenotrophomonas maltophilia]|nr:hypothetical protein [Stenotrophomonas maltophilia]
MTAEQHARSLFDVLPAEVRHLVILGGGSLRAFYDGTEIKDIDCFFVSLASYTYVAAYLSGRSDWTSEAAPNGIRNFRSPEGHLVSLIGFEFGTPHEHCARFDLRCCAHVAIYEPSTDEVVVVSLEGAVADASEKLLFVLNNNGTERTIRRITHYVEDYGYTLHPDQPEQDELFEDDDFPGHAPQGVHARPKAPEPEYILRARRRVRAIPVTNHGYP